MTLTEILTIVENRLATLTKQRESYVASGELSAVDDIDGAIVETQATVDQLKTLVPAPVEPPAEPPVEPQP